METSKLSIAYAIASYGDPEPTTRLVNALQSDDEGAQVLLHRDSRSVNIGSDQLVAPGRITTLKSRELFWGSFELIELFLEFLASAINTDSIEYVILLSGQDYPSRNVHGLLDDLREADAWIDAKSLNGVDEAWMTRYHYRWIQVAKPTVLNRLIWQISRVLVPHLGRERIVARTKTRGGYCYGLRRGLPVNPPIVGGSTWMTLSRKAAIAILDSESRQDPIWRYFRSSLVPDEVSFQTILHSASEITIAPTNRRYIRWPGPKVLDLNDLEAIVDSGADFIRKIELPSSGPLLDELDSLAGRRRPVDRARI